MCVLALIGRVRFFTEISLPLRGLKASQTLIKPQSEVKKSHEQCLMAGEIETERGCHLPEVTQKFRGRACTRSKVSQFTTPLF